jgi:hypothetical protein
MTSDTHHIQPRAKSAINNPEHGCQYYSFLSCVLNYIYLLQGKNYSSEFKVLKEEKTESTDYKSKGQITRVAMLVISVTQ